MSSHPRTETQPAAKRYQITLARWSVEVRGPGLGLYRGTRRTLSPNDTPVSAAISEDPYFAATETLKQAQRERARRTLPWGIAGSVFLSVALLTAIVDFGSMVTQITDGASLLRASISWVFVGLGSLLFIVYAMIPGPRPVIQHAHPITTQEFLALSGNEQLTALPKESS